MRMWSQLDQNQRLLAELRIFWTKPAGIVSAARAASCLRAFYSSLCLRLGVSLEFFCMLILTNDPFSIFVDEHEWVSKKKVQEFGSCQVGIKLPSYVEINPIWFEYLPVHLSSKQTGRMFPGIVSCKSWKMQIRYWICHGFHKGLQLSPPPQIASCSILLDPFLTLYKMHDERTHAVPHHPTLFAFSGILHWATSI